MSEDWREQMKRVERQRAEEQAQYELRSAEADKRWAEATERWAKTEQSIRSLLAIAQKHEREFEGWRKDFRATDKVIDRAIDKARGKAIDERLRRLIKIVERKNSDGHRHNRAEE
jgi:hypothetical protein